MMICLIGCDVSTLYVSTYVPTVDNLKRASWIVASKPVHAPLFRGHNSEDAWEALIAPPIESWLRLLFLLLIRDVVIII